MIESHSRNNVLTFQENPYHEYRLNGQKVDSVTTVIKGGSPTSQRLIGWMVKQGILSCVEQLSQFPEPVSKLPEYLIEEVVKHSAGASRRKAQQAAAVGTLVHEYVEMYEKNLVSKDLLDRIDAHRDVDKIKSCLSKFDEWKRQNNDEILKHEQICASVKYAVGGKFDRLSRRRNSIILSDWKTSSGIFGSFYLQLALYALLVDEWYGIKVDAIEVVRFGKEDGQFETKLISDPRTMRDLTEQAIRTIETTKFYTQYKD